MGNKCHTQLYLQGMVSREEQPDEVKNWFKSRIRIGKSGLGKNTYANRVKEMNSSKNGTLMPDEVYCKRVWEIPDGYNLMSTLEKAILNHFKSLPWSQELRWTRGDWFHDESGIIEEHVVQQINLLNEALSEAKIVEITPEAIDKETAADKIVKQARENKTRKAPRPPCSYTLDSTKYLVKSWADCLRGVVDELYKKQGENFVRKVLNNKEFRGRANPWFSKDKNKLSIPKRTGHLSGAKIYYDLNLSGHDINRRCKLLASHFGYNFSVVTNGKENDTGND